jgi:flagellar assembly factor FliW
MKDATIIFPEGILGMGANTAFVVYDLDDDHRALVARDEPMLSLLIVDPLRVDPDYPIARAFARYPYEPEELAIAAVVTRPIDGSMPTVNLAAPMVFGVASHRAVQVLLEDDQLPLRAPLYRSEAEARACEAPAARAT